MSVDTQKIIEIVKQVKPLFLDREGSSQIKVQGVADFVTQIDFKVQEQVKTALYELYPEIQFMGEEKDNSDIDFDGDVWILDPVDGTTNLIHDFRNSTLSLALAGKGVLTLGIIYHPYSDEIFVAERGKGALLNGSPISVSKRQNFSECLISIGTSPYYRELAKENFRIFEKVFTDCADIRRLGSAALELAYVAAGRIDAYFERSLKPWDYAAGMLLVEEAGGKVTDYKGNPVDITGNSDIVAGNRAIGEILVEKYL